MTKNTKIYFAVIQCMVLLCTGMGIAVRNSFTGYHTYEEMEKAENLQDYHIQVWEAEENDFLGSVREYGGLLKGADLVARVCATKERKMSIYASTKTKAIIKEVYKGSQKTGQEIFIYEPAGFSYAVSQYYDTTGGYQIMKAGEEYYVFLKKLKTAAGYRMSGQEKNTFLPSTALYSKFPIKKGKIKLVESGKLEEGAYCYGEVEDLEIITSEQEILTKYQEIKKEVLQLGKR